MSSVVRLLYPRIGELKTLGNKIHVAGETLKTLNFLESKIPKPYKILNFIENRILNSKLE